MGINTGALLGKMVRDVITDDTICFTVFGKDYDEDVAGEVMSDALDNLVSFRTKHDVSLSKYEVLAIDDSIVCFVNGNPVAWFYCYEVETVDLDSDVLVVVGNDTLHRYYFETNSYTRKYTS